MKCWRERREILFPVQQGSGMEINGKTCLYRRKRGFFPLLSASIHVDVWKTVLMKPARKMQQAFSILTEIFNPVICGIHTICEKTQLKFFMEEASKCLVGN